MLALAGCSPGEGEATAAPAPAGAEAIGPSIETVASPAGSDALAPGLTRIGGRPVLTWIERPSAAGARGRVRLAYLDLDAPAGAATTVASGELFANWADRPGVVQGGTGPDGPAYAWWLAKSGEGTYAYSVEVARSTDGGATWTRLGTLHSDTAPAEHGFVTMVPEGAGVRAFWLDGRATVDGGPMTLRTARLSDRIERDSEELLDASVCDCCNTAAALAAGGPVVIYRDRTGDEVRDPYVVRRTADGWSSPAPLAHDGWRIAACPVNGPALAASGDHLWVTWFTAADGRGRVLAARSTDGGASFGEPVLVDGDVPLGRLDLQPDAAGGAVVSWLGTADGEGAGERSAAVRLRRLAPDGRLGPVVEVAHTEGSRASGVPRLLADGDRLLVAWVAPAEGSRSGAVRIASVPFASVPLP